MNQPSKTRDSSSINSINFKSEAWKYTPSRAFEMTDFILKDYDQANDSWGMGPTEDQFQAISFQDLISDQRILSHKPIELPNGEKVSRASLDGALEKHTSNQEEKSILLKNSLPTSAWLNMNMMPSRLSMTIEKNLKQSFCLFESSQKEGLSQQMKVHLSEDAELDFGLHLNSEHKTYRQFNFVLEKGAKLNLFNLFNGSAKYKRLEIRVYLIGKNTSININGLSLSKDDSIFDYHSDIIHMNQNQETTQIYRSLNQDTGHSIFSGRIHLTESGAGAQVEQLNNNLLLNKKSRVDTQPELNIYQDDVKASHGATTGSLDKDHFFYIMSRGFKLAEAKKMLLEGFCIEPLNGIENPGIKTYFKNRIIEEL